MARGPRPASSPSPAQSGEADAADGGGARRKVPAGGGARRAWGGAGRGRRCEPCALTSLPRAGSSHGHGAGARRPDRGAGATMPVTGKSFRRRRADSESEEDEQESEEVRCVWDGASKGQEESRLRDLSPASLLFVSGNCPFLQTKTEAPGDEAAAQ